MSISVNKNPMEFHLFNQKISYIIRVDEETGEVLSCYFGKHIQHKDSYSYLSEKIERPCTTSLVEGNHKSSLEFMRREYPDFGHGDFRTAAFDIHTEVSGSICEFKYVGYNLFKGRKAVQGKPHLRIENEKDAETLEIILVDAVSKVRMILTYLILEESASVVRSVRFVNEGKKPVIIKKAMSFSMDFRDKDYKMLSLSGTWARERHIEKSLLHPGVQSVYSTRGTSGHTFNPFFALMKENAEEYQGEVYGFSLLYSGNFLGLIDVDTFETARVMMGIHPQDFSWKLNTSEEFETPECIMTYSSTGLNDLSQELHKIIMKHIVREEHRQDIRPVLINNWEATYFDFNEEKIIDFAEEAATLGFDLFVLDDGWFEGRNDDTTSLSDWNPDLSKLPEGISGLSRKVKEMGISFGLWFEPEMVSKGTNIFETHPEYLVGHPMRKRTHGRNQYVLDFSNDEVVELVFGMMEKILTESEISYIKWDMNRSITEAWSMNLPAERQGEFYHRYIMGVYKLYEKLIDAFPEVLFESCASGGGRFDPGMLYYAPQTWASDDTDAWERVKIQYGTSVVYPLKTIGTHVSAVPNHQVGRITSLKARNETAYFGSFGYEMDITKMSEEEKNQVRKHILFFKEKRQLIQHGDLYRLLSPFEGNIASWMVLSKDQKEGLVYICQALAIPNAPQIRIKLKGLNEKSKYQVVGSDHWHYGDELMYLGILFNEHYFESADNVQFVLNHDFRTYLLEIKEI